MKKDLMLLIIDRVNVMDQVRAISQDSSLEPDPDRFTSDVDKEAIRLFSNCFNSFSPVLILVSKLFLSSCKIERSTLLSLSLF